MKEKLLFKADETIVYPRRRMGFWSTVTMLMVGLLLAVFLWRTEGLESDPVSRFDQDTRIAELEHELTLRDREIALLESEIKFWRDEATWELVGGYDYRRFIGRFGDDNGFVPRDAVYPSCNAPGITASFMDCGLSNDSWQFTQYRNDPFNSDHWLMDMMSQEFRYTFGDDMTSEEVWEMVRRAEENGPPPLPFPLPSKE